MTNGQRGFTLIELLIVMGLAGILMGIAALQMPVWLEKGRIESEAMQIYSELMSARQSAMNMKRPATVVMKNSSFQVYSTLTTTVGAKYSFSLPYSLLSGTALVPTAGMSVSFNENGFTTNTATFCIESGGSVAKLNKAAYDSIVISGLRIRIGKRTAAGASCDDSSGTIQLK